MLEQEKSRVQYSTEQVQAPRLYTQQEQLLEQELSTVQGTADPVLEQEQSTVQYSTVQYSTGLGTGAPHTAGTADPVLEQEQSTVQYSKVQV